MLPCTKLWPDHVSIRDQCFRLLHRHHVIFTKRCVALFARVRVRCMLQIFGLPEGVLQLLTAAGSIEAAESSTHHAAVDTVFSRSIALLQGMAPTESPIQNISKLVCADVTTIFKKQFHAATIRRYCPMMLFSSWLLCYAYFAASRY